MSRKSINVREHRMQHSNGEDVVKRGISKLVRYAGLGNISSHRY